MIAGQAALVQPQTNRGMPNRRGSGCHAGMIWPYSTLPMPTTRLTGGRWTVNKDAAVNADPPW